MSEEADAFHSEQLLSQQGSLLTQHLAEVPFEELQELRSRGIGFVSGRDEASAGREEEGEGRGKRKRANKNRPMEMSSKRPVPRLREVVEAPKPVVRDPRFETLCGDLDETRFKRSYRFLYDETLPKEEENLKKMLRREKSVEKRDELKRKISEIGRTRLAEVARRRKEEEETRQKAEQKGKVEDGKMPFFLPKSKRRHKELVEKFKELKAQGKLEAFMAKRRKRNATKEHKKVPRQRRT